MSLSRVDKHLFSERAEQGSHPSLTRITYPVLYVLSQLGIKPFTAVSTRGYSSLLTLQQVYLVFTPLPAVRLDDSTNLWCLPAPSLWPWFTALR